MYERQTIATGVSVCHFVSLSVFLSRDFTGFQYVKWLNRNGSMDRGRVWGEDSRGPKEHCVRRGSQQGEREGR